MNGPGGAEVMEEGDGRMKYQCEDEFLVAIYLYIANSHTTTFGWIKTFLSNFAIRNASLVCEHLLPPRIGFFHGISSNSTFEQLA